MIVFFFSFFQTLPHKITFHENKHNNNYNWIFIINIFSSTFFGAKPTQKHNLLHEPIHISVPFRTKLFSNKKGRHSSSTNPNMTRTWKMQSKLFWTARQSGLARLLVQVNFNRLIRERIDQGELQLNSRYWLLSPHSES